MYLGNDVASFLLGATLALLLGRAAWLDLRQRRIPNGIVAAVAILGLLFAASGGFLALAAAVATAVVVLGVGVAVWRLGWLGGGDVKLAAALGLWAGPSHLAELLLVIALGGGVLAVVVGAARHPAFAPIATLLQVNIDRLLPAAPNLIATSPIGATSATDAGTGSIPYGVAIAFGGACLLHRLFLAEQG